MKRLLPQTELYSTLETRTGLDFRRIGLFILALLVTILIGVLNPLGSTNSLQFPLEVYLVGFLSGYLVGAFGLGMGAITVPVLILLNVNPVVAIASSLILQVVTVPVGAASHLKLGNVKKRIFIPLAAAGILGAFFGGIMSSSLSLTQLIALVGGGTILAGLSVLVRPPGVNGLSDDVNSRKKLSQIVIIGVLAGFSTGAVGTGWGPVGVTGLLLTGLAPRFAIGTSITARALVALIGGTTLFALQSIQWAILIPLLLGGAVSTSIGAPLSQRLPYKVLRILIAATVTLLGMLVLAKILG